MVTDGEHFCMHFYGHKNKNEIMNKIMNKNKSEKVLFHSVAHFFIGLLILGEFSFLSSLYILIISPLSDA
jgi:hypothetical protein